MSLLKWGLRPEEIRQLGFAVDQVGKGRADHVVVVGTAVQDGFEGQQGFPDLRRTLGIDHFARGTEETEDPLPRFKGAGEHRVQTFDSIAAFAKRGAAFHADDLHW
jgi:hypothetical protein